MGVALFKIKVMPDGLDVDLDVLKEDAKKAIESSGGSFTDFEIQNIAFGLKALIVGARLDEEKPGEVMEENLAKMPGVSSVEVIDYRRAIE